MVVSRHLSHVSGFLVLVVATVIALRSGGVSSQEKSGNVDRVVTRSRVKFADNSKEVNRDFTAASDRRDQAPELSNDFRSPSIPSVASDDAYSAEQTVTHQLEDTFPPWKSSEISWTPVQSEFAGRTLSSNGFRADVVSFQQVSGSGGVALSLLIGPADAPDAVVAKHDKQSDATAVLDGPAAASVPESSYDAASMGLSYEQQLFRTKWGWNAFEQVQKALREETSD